MANNFTTSVNILRDTERDFSYIPTPNAGKVVNQIVNDFKKVFAILISLGLMGPENLLSF